MLLVILIGIVVRLLIVRVEVLGLMWFGWKVMFRLLYSVVIVWFMVNI